MAIESVIIPAPVGAVMPAAAQEIVLWIAIVALGAFLLLGLQQSIKHRSALPLLFFVAGFVTILLEPMCTNFGHAIHPEIGQISLFKTFDRAIPWHIATIYSFYFGGVYLFMFRRIRENGFTRDFVWKSYLSICALAYAIEIVPVHIGLWVYYPPQALWVWSGGMPLFWTFVNAACIFMGLTLIKVFYPLMQGWKQLLVIPLSAMGAIMGHFGAGFPYYHAANSAASPMLVELSGLASVGLAFLIVFLCTRLLSGNTATLMAASPSTSPEPRAAAAKLQTARQSA